MSTIQPRLQYNYAQVDPETGYCVSCGTYSYQVPLYYYITIPYTSEDYIHKYYSFDRDLWYEDASMTIEATEVNAMYHG